MQNLFDADAQVRREASQELVNQAENSPHEIESQIHELLEVIKTSTDDMVTMQVSLAISTTCEKIPETSKKFTSEIMAVLEFLSAKPLSADSNEIMVTATVTHLFNSQVGLLQSDIQALQKHLPLLFKYLKKGGDARWGAYRVIAQVVPENPRIFKDYVGDLIDLVLSGSKELSGSLLMLYSINPGEFENRLHLLFRLYETDSDLRTLVMSVFLEISRNRPELFKDHLELMVVDLKMLQSPMTATNCTMIMSEVAREYPNAVYPYLGNLKMSVEYVDTLRYTIPNLVGLIGQMSEEVASEVLSFLAELLADADQNLIAMILSEFRNLAELNRELLEPHMPMIRGYLEDPQQIVRNQANLIIDYMEGRDLHTLASQIEQQNAMIREAALSVDLLKEYVDQNVEMLKLFLADVVKKLPVPINFSTEGRLSKTLKLHFTCSLQLEQCLYPEERPFITETKYWHKWLKIAMSAVSIGKAIIFPFEAGEAIDAVRGAYDMYKGKDDLDFLKYISEPFLTAEEQDKLVVQLREARFFDVFNYDASTADWACMMCNPKRA